MTISVVIVALNEQDWIENCLLSAKQITSEIIVVIDDRTTDKTAEIAIKMGAKVFLHKFVGFSETKNFAFSKTTSDWVFFLDGDERISKELSDEILNLKDTADAYLIPRQNIILGKKLKYGGWWPDYVTRLIKKDRSSGWSGSLHEVLKVNGSTQKLKGVLYHLTHRGITWMLKTSIEYTPIEAKLRFDANHPSVTWWRFFRVIFTEFFDRLIIKNGWRDGIVGVIEAISQAFNMFLIYVHLWELQKGKSMDTIYKDLDKEMAKSGF